MQFVQAGNANVAVQWPSRRLTPSLMSGSLKCLSSYSRSDGGSWGSRPVSKPYMFGDAEDAHSAAIDYSKGNIEDGVVDGPSGGTSTRTCASSTSLGERESRMERGERSLEAV